MIPSAPEGAGKLPLRAAGGGREVRIFSARTAPLRSAGERVAGYMCKGGDAPSVTQGFQNFPSRT